MKGSHGKRQFLVSGGHFHNDKGYLIWVSLDVESNSLSVEKEEQINHPYPDKAVKGKGLTGMLIHDSEIWMSFSNVIVSRSLKSPEFIRIVEDAHFNDLHQIELTSDGILIANTGNESVDKLSFKNGKIERIEFLSSHLQEYRQRINTTDDTKPHLYHISSVCSNEQDDIIVGLARQNRVLNLTNWSWIGSLMSSLVHDVQIDSKGILWWTTICGEIWNYKNKTEHKVFDLKTHQKNIGWTRGIAITEEGILVGTTAIRPSNSSYFTSRTGLSSTHRPSCLTWLPFDKKTPILTTELPQADFKKVFTIREILA